MYIDIEVINNAAKLLGSLTVLGGALIAGYKFFAMNKRQNKDIKAIQSEQTLTIYGVLACLKGLKEQGCNGPVTEALNKIEKHLNQAAHHQEDTE